MRRPVVAVVTDYLPPSTRGGAMRALVAMLDALHDDVEFHVITRDHDGLTGEPLAVNSAGRWVQEGAIKVLRLSKEMLTVGRIADAISKVGPDVIFANSLFSRLTQRLLWARWRGRFKSVPLVIAPEGELDAGALAIKPWRKRIWLWLARQTGLTTGICWKAVTRIEADSIAKAVPSAPVAVLPHLPVQRLIPGNHVQKAAGLLCLLFLSRITPMKNLGFLLETLRHVSARVKLTIVGPVEDQAHWDECQRLIAKLPGNIAVTYAGPCAPDEVWPYYLNAGAFVLPTLGENYGYVIEDALRAGCPPVISDRTPWQQVEENAAGYVLPLETARWVDVLEVLAAMDEGQHSRLRQRAMDVLASQDNDSGLAADYVAMFKGNFTTTAS